jgi:hypothetical protein
MHRIPGSHILHGLTVLILLCTLSLFAYELRKPPLRAQAASVERKKPRAFAAVAAPAEQLVRLPELPDRYKRKVIYFHDRYRGGKKYPLAVGTGTPYLLATRAATSGLE